MKHGRNAGNIFLAQQNSNNHAEVFGRRSLSTEGLWYSSDWIAKSLGMPRSRMHDLLRGPCGLIARFKEVPAANKNGGRSISVHIEGDVRLLLGLPQNEPSPKNARTRFRKSLQTHLKWKQLKADGLSFGQIAGKHNDETGEHVTPQAVFGALTYLELHPPRTDGDTPT